LGAESGVPKETSIRWSSDLLKGSGDFGRLSTPLKSIGRLCCGVRKNC